MAKAAKDRPRFDRATLAFLKELAANNDREWFATNKPRYEAAVLDPALAFIEAMGPKVEKISAHFLAVPKRSGGSLMRVYRDTRFGHDKSPYKTNIGIQFRHELGKDVHAPGFYVHIEPAGCFLGAGIWHPEPAALAAIRGAIVEQPGVWKRARDHTPFAARFELAGSSLQRPPRGFSAEAPHLDDLKRKDFIAICTIDEHDIVAADFESRVHERFMAAKPLMRFLCKSLDLAF